MSGGPCRKGALDCNGDLMEAASPNILILGVHGLISEEALTEYNEIKEKFAKRYKKWKEKHIDFDDI